MKDQKLHSNGKSNINMLLSDCTLPLIHNDLVIPSVHLRKDMKDRRVLELPYISTVFAALWTALNQSEQA